MQCYNDKDCSFLFHCQQSGKCEHDSVFPISLYSIFVYILIPLASGLVNTTGNSMGIFKVLIVMNLLRYESTQATMVAQALVVGTALPNYFSILVRKHPTMQSSLVNFNLVYILVPCSLLGSTLGSLAGQFIPIIGQDILIAIVFSYFALNFYRKYQSIKVKQNELKDSLLTNQNSESIIEEQIKTDQITNVVDQHYSEQQQKIMKNSVVIIPGDEDNQSAYQDQRNKQLAYENSIHAKDIGLSILVFVIFQFLVFLVQGQLPFVQFSQCQWKYWTGIVLLIAVTFLYLKFIKKYLRAKFQMYERLNIEQEIHLNKDKEFKLIVLGGFLAGIVQGILGVGSGSCIMAVLLMTPINTTSASATSGYQILFIGLAALTQGFINGEVDVVDTAFYMADCIVLGGAVTLAITHFLKGRDQARVSRILVFIIFVLSIMSVIMVIPSGLSTYFSSGWGKMSQIRFHC